MNPDDSLYIFIMAGGSGERFWPLSRKRTPKQLLKLFSDETLLGETVKRVQPMVAPQNLFILTNESQVDPTKELLPWFPPRQIIGEPAKRDTAPAAALATAIAHARNPDAVVVLLPADQLIQDQETFRRNLSDATTVARDSDALITLAIKPDHAATGFGYLQLGDPHHAGQLTTQFATVDQFVEKPDLPTAESYLAGGRHFWNAGIFVWKAAAFENECSRLQPELAAFIQNFPADDFTDHLKKHFPGLPKISVDYAIMEQASSVIAAKTEFDWDDVGSWTALPAHMEADANNNTPKGPNVLFESTNNIVFSTGRTVALCGVSNLVVVETADAVLVCSRDQVQDIKKLLPSLPDELM